MSAWDDLVTTALLGTERRALPDELPAPVATLARAQPDRSLALLAAAAGYATYLKAGARPGSCPAPGLAPRQRVDFAPDRAQRLLREVVRSREVPLVDAWLRTCTLLGLGVRPRLWTDLATAAATPRGPDRGLVMAALGERGRAFVVLNPARRIVARAWPAESASVWSPQLTEQALTRVRVTRPPGGRTLSIEATPAPVLRQAVAGTELDAWRRHTGLEPAALLNLLRADAPAWYDVVVTGLVDAAIAQQDQGWSTALLDTGRLDARAQQVLGLSIEIRRSFGTATVEETP